MTRIIRVYQAGVVRSDGQGQCGVLKLEGVALAVGQGKHSFELFASIDAMADLPFPVVPVG